MTRILRWELRRLLCNRVYAGLFAVNAAYAWFILSTDTVLGTGGTAPFSGWSFGGYLAKTLPLAAVTALFLLTRYFSPKARMAEALTSATPVDPAKYALARVAAAALGMAMLCAAMCLLAGVFYAALFGEVRVAEHILPFILTVPPCCMLTLGLGWCLGRAKYTLLYALMIVILALGLLEPGGAFGPFGAGYYAAAPMTLSGEEPAFAPGMPFVLARAGYFAVGAVLLVAAVRGKMHRGLS